MKILPQAKILLILPLAIILSCTCNISKTEKVQTIFHRDPNRYTLTKRIYDVGLLSLEPKQLQRIIKVK